MFVEPKAAGPKPSSPFGRPRGSYYAECVGVTPQLLEDELLGGCILVEHYHTVAPEVSTGHDRSGAQLLKTLRGPEPRRRHRPHDDSRKDAFSCTWPRNVRNGQMPEGR